MLGLGDISVKTGIVIGIGWTLFIRLLWQPGPMLRPEKIGQSDQVGINAFQIPPQGHFQAKMKKTFPDRQYDFAEGLSLDNRRDSAELLLLA